MSRLSFVGVGVALGVMGLLIGGSAYQRYDDITHPAFANVCINGPPEWTRQFNEERRVEREEAANKELPQIMFGSAMVLSSLLIFVIAAGVRLGIEWSKTSPIPATVADTLSSESPHQQAAASELRTEKRSLLSAFMRDD